MRTKSFAGAFVSSLLIATALTPARAADVTSERLLNPQREPQNWLLHHGNYQGHRFSLLKEINTDTVKICLSSSSNFSGCPNSNPEKPVALPPGRSRLSTRPAPTGSLAVGNTIGTVRLARFNSIAIPPEPATITSGASATNSVAYRRMRSGASALAPQR